MSALYSCALTGLVNELLNVLFEPGSTNHLFRFQTIAGGEQVQLCNTTVLINRFACVELRNAAQWAAPRHFALHYP